MRNAGPCPFVKALYDASRYVEFKDDREASANVGFTGEIQGISAGCQYKDDEPIQVTMDVLFEFGKGPQATDNAKTFHYWVAVTDRNREVIAKQHFDLPVKFQAGPGPRLRHRQGPDDHHPARRAEHLRRQFRGPGGLRRHAADGRLQPRG